MRKTVLLHPGFHKTGTTTLQRGLWVRRAALARQLDLLILKDVRPVSLCARAYSNQPTPDRLARLAAAMGHVLAGKDPSDPRPLLISSESLVGHIPGRGAGQAYAHAPDLLEAMVQVIRSHFAHVDLLVWFTTRGAEPWRKSVYYQNVRTLRVTEDYPDFAARLVRAPSLEEVVARVRTCLEGQAVVLSSSLEAAQHCALGHMGEVFDRLGVQWRDPTPPVHENAQDADLLEAFLALNRSSLGDADLSLAKNDVLARHRKRLRRAARAASALPAPWAVEAARAERWARP